MAYSFKLTVRDVLQRPHFKSATLISGQKGVYRVVNWVHIVEVKEIRHLLNGNELILTTGVGWGKTKASRLSFLKQLIERDCAGLCVELGLVFKDIPDDMRKLADEHDFPSSYSRTRSALSTSHKICIPSYMRRSNNTSKRSVGSATG
ncbi:PucR family transcriptional regulator ligand-binding domain-containing protein [Novibacillus thermophilus]|uniref:Purine catabolism PurC-like domain-containing protein n=1 Tax=Novibacillus thermophilus TaxID=1471761 RepID=A0A1U9K6G5_9BACL|nr:PucR family transcriptional regulator ligand-binding domain-containing protein [Novibacillus thermophilus]AQS55606.1 hypothetical protein B0W44_07230 [Novibacillus thermophilus]